MSCSRRFAIISSAFQFNFLHNSPLVHAFACSYCPFFWIPFNHSFSATVSSSSFWSGSSALASRPVSLHHSLYSLFTSSQFTKGFHALSALQIYRSDDKLLEYSFSTTQQRSNIMSDKAPTSQSSPSNYSDFQGYCPDPSIKLHVHPCTPQTRSLMTLLRNKDCARHDFVFYADRLARLAIEFALNFLPTHENQVTTPVKDAPTYNGLQWNGAIVGVPVIRAGMAMEAALRATCRNVRIGKILIQRVESDQNDIGNPQQLSSSLQPVAKRFYGKFPKDLKDRCVILMDPMLATGGTAVEAINMLCENQVPQNKIWFVSMFATWTGIRRVAAKFPDVTIITVEIDQGLNDMAYIVPGCGDFGDRYFGTD